MVFYDLEKQFAIYCAYHSNPINVMLHMCCVWPNFFTDQMLAYFVPLPIPFLPNLSAVIVLIYALFYLNIKNQAGVLAALVVCACYYGAHVLAPIVGFSLTWKIVLAAKLICWPAQILGHNIFEGRKPAFVDNPVQAFLMAPFFVLLEVLIKVFGYELYPGFLDKVKPMTEAEIKAWQDNQKKKVT